MAIRITQAPWVNFTAAMMTVITPLTKAPRPLMNMPVRHPGSFRRMWWTAMPACENVKDVKTPMA